jgi:hypothetical protein
VRHAPVCSFRRRVCGPCPADRDAPVERVRPRDEEEAGEPVVGLDQTLKAEVIFGDQKMELTLEPRWQTPGAYDAYFFPTAAGDYTFHIFGEIEGTAVDESFTSSPEGFSSVEAREELEFPK